VVAAGAVWGGDPMQRLSYLIAAELHYGKTTTTMEPLSAIVVTVKLKNLEVAMVLMLKEGGQRSALTLQI